jgi:hypothetical protein
MSAELTERGAAVMMLLEEPDPPDLPKRGTRLVNPGDPIQLRQARWAYLPQAFVAYCRVESMRTREA